MNFRLKSTGRFHPVFEQDIYEAISMKTCVEKRQTYRSSGATKVMEQIIAENKEYLKNN